MDGPTYHVLSMYVNCKGDYRPSPACNNENAVGVVRYYGLKKLKS